MQVLHVARMACTYIYDAASPGQLLEVHAARQHLRNPCTSCLQAANSKQLCTRLALCLLRQRLGEAFRQQREALGCWSGAWVAGRLLVRLIDGRHPRVSLCHACAPDAQQAGRELGLHAAHAGMGERVT